MASKDIRSFFKPKLKTNVELKEMVNPSVSSKNFSSVVKHSDEQKKSSSRKSSKEVISISSDSHTDSDIEIIADENEHHISGKKSKKLVMETESYSSNKDVKSSLKRKKKSNIFEEEEEDIINGTPNKQSFKDARNSRLERVNDVTVDVSRQNVKKKMKPVNVSNVFNKTVKQSKLEDTSNMNKCDSVTKNMKTELGIHKDDKFEQTLADLDDDDIFLQNVDTLDRTIEEALKNTQEDKHIERQDSNLKKRTLSNDFEDNKANKKTKLEHVDSGIDGQEQFEKKKYCAMLYQKYLNRSGPKNHGRKDLPMGQPDCLANLYFLRTGVLDSLESDEFEDLIQKHGGKVVHSVTKKVNYVVVGDDPGPAKYEKAKKYGIPFINEDELFDLILQKSGKSKIYTVKKSSSFEDDGINDSFNSSVNEETTLNLREKAYSTSSNKNIENDSNEHIQNSNNTVNVKPDTDNDEKENVLMDASRKKTNIETLVDKSEMHLSLTEKYKPKELKDIIGQQMANSNMNKLKKWLEYWNQSEILRKQKKIPQPRPWDKNNDGSYYKCALLSGPPGVGKTTTATLVSKTLGFDIVEFNASDTRSKKLLQEEVRSALNTKTIRSFNTNNFGLDSKRVILMDEVDGMAGNADRGGMQELILLIKESKIPIICMCNDRNNTKIRSLANYCFDLRFEKPKPQQIMGFVMSICCKEGINMTPKVISEIISGTTCDVRQTLNQVTVLSSSDSDISLEQAKKDSVSSKKDTVLGPWQVCKMVFDETDQRGMSLMDKSRLFFYDYSLGPLFVQENYLKVQPNVEGNQILKRAADAAEAISFGAKIDKNIRESNNWSLLDLQAIYSSVLPGHYMSGKLMSMVDFPSWLGKNSKRTKFSRFNKELVMHTRMRISGGSLAMNLDYGKALLRLIASPLKKKGLNGVSEAVEVMKSYQLLREDLDSLQELYSWSNTMNLLGGIDSKVKAAFTRTYKKEVPAFSYSNIGTSKGKSSSIVDEEFDEEEDNSVEADDKIENDSLIKLKQRKGGMEKTEKVSKSKKTKSKSKGKS